MPRPGECRLCHNQLPTAPRGEHPDDFGAYLLGLLGLREEADEERLFLVEVEGSAGPAALAGINRARNDNSECRKLAGVRLDQVQPDVGRLGHSQLGSEVRIEDAGFVVDGGEDEGVAGPIAFHAARKWASTHPKDGLQGCPLDPAPIRGMA